MSVSNLDKALSLRQAIFKVAREYGEVSVDAGIVYVQLLNGEIWDFTVPEKIKEDK